MRQISQSWNTSNGVFKTDRMAELELKFPEYSNSKRFSVNPDIIYYEDDAYEPKFDLILGT